MGATGFLSVRSFSAITTPPPHRSTTGFNVPERHAGERTGTHRAREIGMDDIATVAAHRHRLGKHSLELISSRHHERPSPFPSNVDQVPSLKSGAIASTNDRSASSRASTPFPFTPGRR